MQLSSSGSTGKVVLVDWLVVMHTATFHTAIRYILYIQLAIQTMSKDQKPDDNKKKESSEEKIKNAGS